MNLLQQEPQPWTPSYREIQLTQGQVALVDTADYEWLSQWKWCLVTKRRTGDLYASRRGRSSEGRSIVVYMHREILGLFYGDKRQGDHRNRNSLDNRRSNLRLAMPTDNARNRGMNSLNTSGFKGVSYDKRTSKWRASIYCKRKHKSVGYFPTKEEAARAYDAAAKLLFGEFAQLNFP